MALFQFFFLFLGKPVFVKFQKTAGIYGDKKLRKKSTEIEISSHNLNMAHLQNLLSQLQEHLSKTTAEVACQTEPFDLHDALSNIWPNILQSYIDQENNLYPDYEQPTKKARTSVPCTPSHTFYDDGLDSEGAEDDFVDLNEPVNDKLFDDSSHILHRKECIYVASRQEGRNHGFTFHDTLKKRTETWNDAESRHQACNHPLLDKREKLVKLIADQERRDVKEIRKQLEPMTTVELFYLIKKDSPLLLKSLSAKDIH